MQRLQCAELWGGVKNEDLDVCSPGLTLSLYSSACDGDRGGDVYYFSVCNAERVTRVVLADVAGHGRHVSQLGSWLHDEMAARLDDPDLPALMGDVNRRACSPTFNRMATAVAVSYYKDLHHAYFCYAGHPPMMITRNSDGWKPLPPADEAGLANLPWGVDTTTRYGMYDAPVSPEDTLLIYSDGVIEAANPQGELFGADRLTTALNDIGDSDPMAVKAGVLAALQEWTQKPFDHDDVTLISIRPLTATA